MGGAGFSSTWALGPRERGKSKTQNLDIQGKIMASEAKILYFFNIIKLEPFFHWRKESQLSSGCCPGGQESPGVSPSLGPSHSQGAAPSPDSPWGVSTCRKAIQLFQGKPPQTEDDRESLCTPLSCGWEMAETLCVTPIFAPASII